MMNYHKEVHLIQTLPTEFPSNDEEDAKDDNSRKKFYYDTFAFRDRITNNRFHYKEAREDRQLKLSFLEWTTSQSLASRDLKDSLNVYKYTKNFEIDCIRSKYLRQTHSQKSLKSKPNFVRTYNDEGQKHMSRETLFQINKQEMKRVLQTNEHVSADILRVNNCRSCMPKHPRETLKKNMLKWRVLEGNALKEHEENSLEGECGRRVTDKIINHMKHEINSNCEYLLSMSLPQRRKALFNSQLTRFRNIKKLTLPRYSHTEVESCRFAAHDHQQKTQQEEPAQSEEAKVIQLVRKGFINEAYLELKDNPQSCMSRDNTGNNIFHLAAKSGNIDMATIFFKVITPRNCLALLAGRNNLKRTPVEKANMLGYKQLKDILELFIKQYQKII